MLSKSKHPHRFKRKIFNNLVLVLIVAITGSMGSNSYGQQEALEEVVVTGSRIVRRDFEANSPILTIENEMFDQNSGVGIENSLNKLPQFVPAATQFDNDPFQAGVTNTPGASTLSLRGLAANRNLVLLDGRRAMPINATMAVDINTIPSAAIQRLEVITGGASSVYGADAVAGVVNFILKKDFEGADFDVQWGSTMEGDGDEYRISGLIGANFADGDGNVMFGMDFSDRGEVYRRDRKFYRDGWADPTMDGSELFGTDTSMQFIGGNLPSQDAVNDIFVFDMFNGLNGDTTFDQNVKPTPAVGAIPPGGQFWLNDDGTLYQGLANFGASNGNNAGLSRYKGELVVDGLTKRKLDQQGDLEENQLLSLLSVPLKRYSMFANARYEMASGLEAFIQGNFSQYSTETAFQFSPAIGGWSLNIPHGDELYAPSVDAGGNTLPEYLLGGAFGLDCEGDGVAGCTNSEAFPTPIELTHLLDSRDDPNGEWQLNKVQDFNAPRVIENNTRVFQLTFGLNGDIPAIDGSWDVALSHGNTLIDTHFVGFSSLSRYRAIGQSANYGKNFFQQGNQQQGGFSSGIGTCTSGLPFFFDISEVTQDCIDSMRVDLQNVSEMNQDYAELNLQGRIIDMPAGELRFALGAGWRKNDYLYNFDPLNTQTSFTDLPLGAFPADNTSGETSVKEFYGELLIPIIGGIPAIDALNLELGYRYSDYDLFGGIDTYKGLIDWTVNDSIRFRGGYQLATRAPNLAELFQAEAQEFYIGAPDPCSEFSVRGVNSANPTPPGVPPRPAEAAEIRELCEKLMGPTGAAEFYRPGGFQENVSPFVTAGFFNVVGNPEVQPEEATTLTAGFVYQSVSDHALLSAFSLTLDWYKIEIEDMISVQSPIAVYDQCLSPASNPDRDPNTQACSQTLRNPDNGFQQATNVTYGNTGYLETSGVDIQLNWGAEIADMGMSSIPGFFNMNVLINYLLKFETQASSTERVIDWKGSLGPDFPSLNGGSYDYRIFTTFNYSLNDVAISLRHRYLPDAVASEEAFQPGGAFLGAEDDYHIFDLSGSWTYNDSLAFRFGIDNLLDEDPVITGGESTVGGQLPRSGAGITHEGFYDTLGRRYYVGLKFNM